METAIEASYSLGFRSQDVTALEELLQMHHSVELIGMKRVGIDNFLRFFLTHKNIPQEAHHLFILVDLNTLIERELFAFWRLTFKRIADAVRDSSLDKITQARIAKIFDKGIQSGDLFLTYDGVRESLEILAKAGITPIIIFSRFDRLKDAITDEFFDNLQSLKDATGNKLSYVFTTYRELETLAPLVFKTKSVAIFSRIHYIKPAESKDMEVILASFEERYAISIEKTMREQIIFLSGGHVQYLQLLLIIYYELSKKENISLEEFKQIVEADERIMLQSEELWESLTKEEQEILKKTLHKQKFSQQERGKAKYLWDTGFITQEENSNQLFSSLFSHYLAKMAQQGHETMLWELTKKEHTLFSYLQENVEGICEREKIIEIVWPEYKDYGVSDWSVDKLVARVRNKLKKQKSEFEIITVKTRGYKLVSV